MRQILVNPICRAGSTCLKEIDVGGKVIRSIQTLPKLQSKSDVRLFFDKENIIPDFDALVLDLWSLPELSKALFIGKGQRRVEDNEIAITPVKMKMDEKVVIIDPSSEEYHYPYPLKKDPINGNRLTRRDAILSLKGYPMPVKQVFNEFGKDAGWRTLEAKNLLLSYVDWYIQYCVKYGASVILPPSPLIDGSSQPMIEISKAINNTSQAVTRERTEAYPASYIPILSEAFDDEKRPQRILDMIYDIARPHSIVALKFFRSGKSLEQIIQRKRIREFLMAIDALKKDNHDNLAILVLDTKAEGMAYFGNGVDLTCDPLGGIKDIPSFRKKKVREDTGDELEGQPEEFKHYGRYYHHIMREFLTIPEIKTVLDPSGQLPHKCEFCVNLADSLVKQKDDPGFPRQDQWNEGRRIHNFTCRREEDEIMREKISAGDTKAIELFLKENGRGNKNLIDLIP
jgi:hypothetical protein